MIRAGRLYLPVRCPAEAFGYAVQWNQPTRSVVIVPDRDRPLPPKSGENNLQIVPVPPTAPVGHSVLLGILVTGSGNQPVPGVTVY